MNRRSFLRTVALVAVAPLVAAVAPVADAGNGYASRFGGRTWGRVAHAWAEITVRAGHGVSFPVGSVVFVRAGGRFEAWRVDSHTPTDDGRIRFGLVPA